MKPKLNKIFYYFMFLNKILFNLLEVQVTRKASRKIHQHQDQDQVDSQDQDQPLKARRPRRAIARGLSPS